MGKLYGDEPQYTVHYATRGRRDPHVPGGGQGPENHLVEVFTGDRAFTDASEFYEQMKADPEVCRLSLTRLDGGSWVWVEKPIVRNGQGEWVPV